jgi:hypothetical protein
VDETSRCPWHHVYFSLRTGEALRAPALDAAPCWRVEQRDGNAYVTEKIEGADRHPSPRQGSERRKRWSSWVVVQREMRLRKCSGARGYTGPITMLSAHTSVPCDRPDLSKGYLAGTAPVEFTLLRSPESYEQHRIELKLGARVATIDVASREARLVEQHGVTFHLGTTTASIDEHGVTLQAGEHLPADFIVVGVGVRPAIALAEQAGLAIDRGITVNEYLETSICSPQIRASSSLVTSARGGHDPSG